MKLYRADGVLHLELVADEAGLLAVLAHQFIDLVNEPELEGIKLHNRIFPDAYLDDPESAAQFRHYTRTELEQQKTSAAKRIAELATTGVVRLDHDNAQIWARSLSDLRIMLGTQLGINGNGKQDNPGELSEIYQWLSALQWALVDFLAAE